MPDDKFTLIYIRSVFFVLAIAIVLTDLYLVGRFGSEGTISELLRKIADRWGMFPYLVSIGIGALLYHLFGHR